MHILNLCMAGSTLFYLFLFPQPILTWFKSVANRRGASNFTRCIPPFSKTNPCLKDLPVWVVQPYIRKPLVPNSRKIAAAAAAAVLKGNVDVITGDIASTANAATAATAVVEQGSDTSNPPDADKENNVKGEDKDHPATTTSNEKKRKRVADAIAKKAAKRK